MPTVMIAEDDLLMADMLQDILVDSGYDVCGIARTVGKAVELGIVRGRISRSWMSSWPKAVAAPRFPLS